MQERETPLRLHPEEQAVLGFHPSGARVDVEGALGVEGRAETEERRLVGPHARKRSVVHSERYAIVEAPVELDVGITGLPVRTRRRGEKPRHRAGRAAYAVRTEPGEVMSRSRGQTHARSEKRVDARFGRVENRRRVAGFNLGVGGKAPEVGGRGRERRMSDACAEREIELTMRGRLLERFRRGEGVLRLSLRLEGGADRGGETGGR